MTTTDTRPDLAALRTELRVAVELAHGAKWEAGGALRRLRRFRPGFEVVATYFVDDEGGDEPTTVQWYVPDPTTDIGAAMALVDQLQAEGWPGGRADYNYRRAVAAAMAQVHPNMGCGPYEWLEIFCPPHLKAIVRTLACLAARGAEWRRYLPLLEVEATDA